MDALRDELIQVAAVAVAMVEVIDHDTTADSLSNFKTDRVLEEVLAERRRQDAEWGPQDHAALPYSLILLEEVGEAMEEVARIAPTPPKSEPTTDAVHHALRGTLSLRAAIEAGQHARRWLEEEFGQ